MLTRTEDLDAAKWMPSAFQSVSLGSDLAAVAVAAVAAGLLAAALAMSVAMVLVMGVGLVLAMSSESGLAMVVGTMLVMSAETVLVMSQVDAEELKDRRSQQCRRHCRLLPCQNICELRKISLCPILQ